LPGLARAASGGSPLTAAARHAGLPAAETRPSAMAPGRPAIPDPGRSLNAVLPNVRSSALRAPSP